MQSVLRKILIGFFFEDSDTKKKHPVAHSYVAQKFMTTRLGYKFRHFMWSLFEQEKEAQRHRKKI